MKGEYHLQITNYKKSFDAEQNSDVCRARYKYEVNSFLQTLWEEEGKNPRDTCLLQYWNHCVADVTDNSGVTRRVVKLAFKLKNGVLASEFDNTMKTFCEKVFCKDNWDNLSRISESKLWGLSPVKGTKFAEIWNTGFMSSTFRTGGKNLEDLFGSISNEIRPPGWLKATCFIFSTPFTGEYNFGAWATKCQQIISGDEPDSAECIELDEEGLKARGAKVASVCELLLESAAEADARAMEEKFRPDWKLKLKTFAEKVRLELATMKETLKQNNPTDTSLLPIGSSLFKLAEQAADVCTTNREAMQIYRDLCIRHASTFVRGLAFCIGYLSVAGPLAGAATVAPFLYACIASSGLFIGFTLLAGIRIYMTKKAKREKERYRQIFAMFFEVSRLTSNVHTLVRCVHSADGAETDPESKIRRDVDVWWEKAKKTWKNAPAKVNPQEFRAQHLKIILEETAEYLEDWGEDMNKLIKEL